MRATNPKSLGKSVVVGASNRPVKIAYIVPVDHVSAQLILDAVFYESYTRWGGVYTLVIPVLEGRIEGEGFREWLSNYDPDFLYSYADLDDSVVEELNRRSCPIEFLGHDYSNTDAGELDFRSCLPRLEHYIQPISSITTISSPANLPRIPQEGSQLEPTILTQYGFEPVDQFLADNFGLAYSVNGASNPVLGLFKTLCLVPPDLPPNMVAGTERCHSVSDAFRAICDREALSVARLASLDSIGVPRPDDSNHGYAFRLFVGETPQDRINFWNARHFRTGWSDTPNAMIVNPACVEDERFVKQLGEYLNKNNFMGSGSGQNQVQIYSVSIDRDGLESFKEVLKPATWNGVSVARDFDTVPVPVDRRHSHGFHRTESDATTYKLTEDSTEIVANAPAHLVHLPPQRRGLARGQWVVELDVERHNNLSRYSNVVDKWVLPRRWGITHAFTRRLAKPTLAGRLAVIPSHEGFPFRQDEVKRKHSFEMYLPSDEEFFRYLVIDPYPYPGDDLRSRIDGTAYSDMAVSDKGQNLRGVISLFGGLSGAYEVMTHEYWRDVLEEANENVTRALAFTRDKLERILFKDKTRTEEVTKELRFKNSKDTIGYLKDSLTDSLEYLIRANVFYQVAHWRCRYCGHLNSRSFDQMKIRNECSICETEYLATIDLEWLFELSEFVFRSLKSHSGLPVLWALGHLQDSVHSGNFWYLPEVNLYEDANDPDSMSEIDVLCMLDGKFIAAEVKSSAAAFLARPATAEKFVKVMKTISPDIATLAFQVYCPEDGDIEKTKRKLEQVSANIRNELEPRIKLNVLIAEEIGRYSNFSPELGVFGRRTDKYSH